MIEVIRRNSSATHIPSFNVGNQGKLEAVEDEIQPHPIFTEMMELRKVGSDTYADIAWKEVAR
jgi:hypothetical protein